MKEESVQYTLSPEQEKHFLEALGLERIVKFAGPKRVIAALGPEQIIALLGNEKTAALVIDALGIRKVVKLLVAKFGAKQLLEMIENLNKS